MTADEKDRQLMNRGMDQLAQQPKFGSLFYSLSVSRKFETIAQHHATIDKIARHHGMLEKIARQHAAVDKIRFSRGLSREAFEKLDEASRQMRQWSLPAIARLKDLLASAESSGLPSVVEALAKDQLGIANALRAMRSPWLDVHDQIRSMRGFVGLQSIGLAIQNQPTFGSPLAAQLRMQLGDWRDSITWRKNILADPDLRTSFYKTQGLNSDLTDFPVEAFYEATILAGLATEPVPYSSAFDATEASEDSKEEAGLARTNAAHDQLLRFETHLRKFIDERMHVAFGKSWIKHNVPADMRDRWVEKKKRAIEAGETEHPLIAYADFTDYVTIITRRDNWETVFAPVFRRAESVRESFQRLYPIRLCTMHARIVTQDDELYLFVETKRILSAIKSIA